MSADSSDASAPSYIADLRNVRSNDDTTTASSARAGSRIVLCSDAPMRRECLSHLLRQRGADLQVECIETLGDAAGSPDIVLLDLKSLNADDGLLESRLKALKARFGDVPHVVVTDRDDFQFAARVIHHGWRGCIPTTLGADVVVAAVRLILAGGTFITRGLIDHYVDAHGHTETREPSPDEGQRLGFITPREADVLNHLRQGKPNKLIAYALNISESTVKVHIRNMMRKLHVTNRTQVAFLNNEPAPRVATRALR